MSAKTNRTICRPAFVPHRAVAALLLLALSLASTITTRLHAQTGADVPWAAHPNYHPGFFQEPLHGPAYTEGLGANGLSASLIMNAGSPELPFWLLAQRDGRIPLHSRANALLLLTGTRAWQSASQRWHLESGASLTTRASDQGSTLQAGRLYAHVRAYGLQLSLGRFPDPIGMGAPGFSTGTMMVSRNAVTPWRVRISTPDFVPIPGTSDYVHFKVRWSEALMRDERYIEHPRIHQKYLYLKIQPVPELHLMGGIVHNLIWGGTHPERGRMHSTFRDWLSDVLAQPESDNNITPVGNGIGAYDFAIEYRTDTWAAGLHRLFYLEDRVSTRFRSPWDGLWSAWLHRPSTSSGFSVDYVLYEHMNTIKQDALPHDAKGRAGYYMHGIWVDGWTHYGQVLGNALITLDPSLVPTGNRPIVNNMVLGHHMALAGQVSPTLRWHTLATYSRNYGVCRDQVPVSNRCLYPEDNPVYAQEGYIPLRDLRKDRYALHAGLSWQTRSSATRRVSTDRDRPGSASSLGIEWHVALSMASGSFYTEPRLGVQAGISVSRP